MRPIELFDLQNKFMHLKALVGIVLPKESQPPELSEDIEELLEADDDDDDETLTLSRLRELNVEAGAHDFAWNEGVHGCKIAFEAGDFGYIARDCVQMMDKSRFNDFVKIGNIFDVARGGKGVPAKSANAFDSTHVIKESTGLQMQWVNGFMQRCETWPFMLPGDVEGQVFLLAY